MNTRETRAAAKRRICRPESSPVNTALAGLRAEQRDIDAAIYHLQRLQTLRTRRRDRLGTWDLDWVSSSHKKEERTCNG